jgi:hypothetical protein
MFASRMLPRFFLEYRPSPPDNLGGPGGGGSSGGAGGGGGGGGYARPEDSPALALANKVRKDVGKTLGHVLQLGQPAQEVVSNSGRNAVVSKVTSKNFGTRRSFAQGMGSNNTPVAMFGGGALHGRGGPGATE